jgi:hypothetical protein
MIPQNMYAQRSQLRQFWMSLIYYDNDVSTLFQRSLQLFLGGDSTCYPCHRDLYDSFVSKITTLEPLALHGNSMVGPSSNARLHAE